jgi:cytochrome c-type biogenesis protein CcmE
VSKGVQIAIGALAVGVLVGWYGWTALEGAGTYNYYQTLDEFRAAYVAGPARVHGFVAHDSIDRDVAAKAVRFALQQSPPHAAGAAGSSLSVHYASLETPDLFKEGAEVVVEGELAVGDDGPVFHATKLFAKCPSKFEAEAAKRTSF